MLARRLSIRVSLAIAIIAMGFLAMVLAYISGEIYRNKAMDVQRASLSELLDLKVNDIIHHAHCAGYMLPEQVVIEGCIV